MDTVHAILALVVLILVVDKLVTQHNWMKQQDKMNRALISKTVPEYDYKSQDEIKKMELENDLAREADNLLKAREKKNPHYPVT